MTIASTPTDDRLPRRYADFATLGEALDYAASGVRGSDAQLSDDGVTLGESFGSGRRGELVGKVHDGEVSRKLVARAALDGDVGGSHTSVSHVGGR